MFFFKKLKTLKAFFPTSSKAKSAPPKKLPEDWVDSYSTQNSIPQHFKGEESYKEDIAYARKNNKRLRTGWVRELLHSSYKVEDPSIDKEEKEVHSFNSKNIIHFIHQLILRFFNNEEDLNLYTNSISAEKNMTKLVSANDPLKDTLPDNKLPPKATRIELMEKQQEHKNQLLRKKMLISQMQHHRVAQTLKEGREI